MKNIIPLLCIFFASSFYSLSGQGVARGISNGQITIIEIGNNTDLWIGTADSGAYHYTSNMVFVNSYTNLGYVNTISLASVNGAQNAFIGTTTGLTDVLTGSLVAASGSVLPQANVSSLFYKPSSDQLYVFTAAEGGDVLDSLMQFHNNLSLPFSKITCSFQAGCSGLIAGSVDSGAFYSGDYVTDTILRAPNLVSDSVTAVYIVNSCNARLVGTRHGFSFCATGHPCQNYTRASTSGKLPQDYISAITQDCFGNIWLGMPDSGLVEFVPPTQSFKRVDLPADLSQVTALAASAAGCSGITYVGTANGDIVSVDTALAVLQVLNTAVQSLSENQLSVRVFPQPAFGTVNFVFDNTVENGQFSITDITGRTLGNYEVKNVSKLTLDISTISNGLYLYHVINNGQLVSTGKFEIIR